MPKKELHDVVLHLHHETDKAILCSETGRREDAFWLPKSQIEFEAKQGRVEVTLPAWLASEKKLAGF